MSSASTPYDYRADIYSCGKIAFLMSTGLYRPDGIDKCRTPADLVPLLRAWKPLDDLAEGLGSVDYKTLVFPMLDDKVSARPGLTHCLSTLRNQSGQLGEMNDLSPTEVTEDSPRTPASPPCRSSSEGSTSSTPGKVHNPRRHVR